MSSHSVSSMIISICMILSVPNNSSWYSIVRALPPRASTNCCGNIIARKHPKTAAAIMTLMIFVRCLPVIMITSK